MPKKGGPTDLQDLVRIARPPKAYLLQKKAFAKRINVKKKKKKKKNFFR